MPQAWQSSQPPQANRIALELIEGEVQMLQQREGILGQAAQGGEMIGGEAEGVQGMQGIQAGHAGQLVVAEVELGERCEERQCRRGGHPLYAPPTQITHHQVCCIVHAPTPKQHRAWTHMEPLQPHLLGGSTTSTVPVESASDRGLTLMVGLQACDVSPACDKPVWSMHVQ